MSNRAGSVDWARAHQGTHCAANWAVLYTVSDDLLAETSRWNDLLDQTSDWSDFLNHTGNRSVLLNDADGRWHGDWNRHSHGGTISSLPNSVLARLQLISILSLEAFDALSTVELGTKQLILLHEVAQLFREVTILSREHSHVLRQCVLFGKFFLLQLQEVGIHSSGGVVVEFSHFQLSSE